MKRKSHVGNILMGTVVAGLMGCGVTPEEQAPLPSEESALAGVPSLPTPYINLSGTSNYAGFAQLDYSPTFNPMLRAYFEVDLKVPNSPRTTLTSALFHTQRCEESSGGAAYLGTDGKPLALPLSYRSDRDVFYTSFSNNISLDPANVRSVVYYEGQVRAGCVNLKWRFLGGTAYQAHDELVPPHSYSWCLIDNPSVTCSVKPGEVCRNPYRPTLVRMYQGYEVGLCMQP